MEGHSLQQTGVQRFPTKGGCEYCTFDLQMVMSQRLFLLPQSHGLVGTYNTFTQSKGERLNPKIEQDIHFVKFTSKNTRLSVGSA